MKKKNYVKKKKKKNYTIVQEHSPDNRQIKDKIVQDGQGGRLARRSNFQANLENTNLIKEAYSSSKTPMLIRCFN